MTGLKKDYGCIQSEDYIYLRIYTGVRVKKAKYKYTCWHCGTGMVISLPAICPECERLLTKEA